MAGWGGTRLKRFLTVLRQWPAVLATGLVLAVDVFDSFGLDQAADEQAAQIIGTITAPFYGQQRIGQRAVTVVLIDEASLAHHDWPFPVPYQNQAEIAETLALFDPAAIFFDFSYMRPHGDDRDAQIAEFRDRLLAISADGGPPVYIGEVGALPEFTPLREMPQAGIAWRDPSWLNYPMVSQGQAEWRRASNGVWEMTPERDAALPMAAPLLYEAWCARSGSCDPNWRPPRDPDSWLALTWGFGGSAPAAALRGVDPETDPCTLARGGLLTRASIAIREAVRAFGREFYYREDRGDAREARCIYADSFNVATLLDGRSDDLIEPLVRDRVVLVGASNRQSADLQTIPHVGVVPGVFVHAMATDNLIEQGPRHLRPPPTVFLALDLADVVEIILSIALFATVWFMARGVEALPQADGRSDRERTTRRRLIFGGFVLIGIVFIVAAALIEWALHWPHLNVLGVIVLIAAVFPLAERHLNRLAQRQG